MPDWFIISDEFIQARLLPNQTKLSIYGTYKTNKLIYKICCNLGNHCDIIIEFN